MSLKKNNKVAVIGAGSWGTAIAGILSEKGYITHLWGHRQEHIDRLRKEGKNARYLSEYTFNSNLLPTTNLQDAVTDTPLICMVVPSQHYRGVFKKLINKIDSNCAIVSAVKGIENESLSTMTQIMQEELAAYKIPNDIEHALLSGPSIAKELVAKTPTAVTDGCRNLETAKQLQNYFVTDFFRVYASKDVIGLELSAAFKNIIAIATGICDGIGFGHNTRAALITRGLAEITRIGIVAGADPQTFSGLSGMGDLILTCTGELSRNRTVGLRLGKGKKLDTILAEMKMVAEGVKTSLSGYKLAQRYDIEMPILEQVYQIIYEDKDCLKAVQDLLSRELKIE